MIEIIEIITIITFIGLSFTKVYINIDDIAH